jgi:hypothetical protein
LQLAREFLGADSIWEAGYWIVAAVQILTFIALLTFLLKLTKRTNFSDVLHVLFYPVGVAIFVASLVFSVAALTIYTFYALEFIPSFKVDPSRFLNFEQTILNDYRACLGSESVVYETLRSTGLQFDTLTSSSSHSASA